MTTVQGALLDLDGVLYVGGTLLPGAREALERLRARAMPVRFVTNTTRRPRRMILADLSAMGVTIGDEELVTPSGAACAWLKERGLSPHLLVHLKEDFTDVLSGGAQAVVIGDAGSGFTYGALNRAFRLLMSGAPLLALAKNRYFREPDGLSLDAGPFVAALEFASGRSAEVVGKPAPAFFRTAAAGLGCLPEDTVMVGDDVEADVNGAVAAGLQAILVRTGKFQEQDLERLHADAAVVADFAAAVDRILAESAG